jgi:MEMO1 family protein
VTRIPFVSGSFYPGDREALLKELEAMFPLLAEDEREEVMGAVVPHAGYLYSGRVAGDVYARIKPKKTFVIIGPNHTGQGNDYSVSMENWDTPLGEVEVDVELSEAVIARAPILTGDAEAHRYEHSIEVQLPFIKRFFPETSIVPICISSKNVSELEAVAESIVVSARSLERDIVVLASSDMTHYEPRSVAYAKDRKAIEAMLSIDARDLAQIIAAEGISMCGWAPSVIMLFAASKLGADRARLVRYSDSGDITGNTAEVVGYAGITLSCSNGKE